MRCSIWPSFQRPWTEVLGLARHVEETGWHGLWYADHYMPDTPDGEPSDGRALECWSTLAAVAAAVPRLQLGSLVSPSTVHHPAVLAHQAATIDEISGGRLVLGVGAGWQANEHRAYGIPLPPPGERVDRFAEFIQALRGLLRDQRTTLTGRHFQLVDAPCEPKGVQHPIPIMVGTGSPRMLRLTARFADAWNTWGTPEQVAERSAALDAACEAEARDPATVRRTAQGLFVLTADDASRRRMLEMLPADRAVVGGVDELRERMAAYVAVGVDELVVPDFTLGPTAEARRDHYDRLRVEVIDHLP